MSGWIKMEKDLRQDLRVRKMARALAVTLSRDGVASRVTDPVTLVLGGLAQLWMHGDAFADDQDVMRATLADIDEITGIQGFGELLPPEWLEVIDANHVKLPQFQAHNGSEAKGRASHADRQARYRARKAAQAGDSTPSRVTRHSVTAPSPDQTRPDQTKTQNREGERGRSVTAVASRFDPMKVTGLDQAAWLDWVAYRAQRKPAIKPASMAKAAAAMAALGERQRLAVDHSIANGYQGLIDPKESGNGRRTGEFERIQAKLDERIRAAEAGQGRPLLESDAADVRDPVDDRLRRDPIGALDFGDPEPAGEGVEVGLSRAAVGR